MTDLIDVVPPAVHEVGDHGVGRGPLWLDDMLRADLASFIDIRRRVHAHPELGRRESATSALILRTLESDGIKARLMPSGTGVIAEIGSAGTDCRPACGHRRAAHRGGHRPAVRLDAAGGFARVWSRRASHGAARRGQGVVAGPATWGAGSG